MADLLFELGVEEIPAATVGAIRDQLCHLFQAHLKQDHIACGDDRVRGHQPPPDGACAPGP